MIIVVCVNHCNVCVPSCVLLCCCVELLMFMCVDVMCVLLYLLLYLLSEFVVVCDCCCLGVLLNAFVLLYVSFAFHVVVCA